MINPIWLGLLNNHGAIAADRTPASIVTKAFNDGGVTGFLKSLVTPIQTTPILKAPTATPKAKVVPLESQRV